jgi:hypothetical protein
MTWEPPFQEPTAPKGPFIEYKAGYTAYGPQQPPPGAGPQPGWGAPGPGVNAPPPSLWEAIKQLPQRYWRVLSKPGEATFASEMLQARWDVVWAQILGYALVAAIFATLAWLVLLAFIGAEFHAMTAQTGTANPFNSFGLFLLPAPIFGVFIFISGIVGIFLSQGITYLLARAFGGQGSFLAQVYTGLLYQVPIGLVAAALTIIPFLGSSIGGLAGIYQYVLQFFQVKAVHRLSTGNALAVVLIPVGVATLLVFGLVFLYFVFIISLISSIHPTP